jgi:CRP/FNR family transcriptional regulator, cyclic AMP receptor protein
MPTTTATEPFLQALAFLGSAGPDATAELMRSAGTRRYPKGNILFYHGEPADYVFLVLDGRINISLISDEGREVILATIRQGGIFGLIAALDGGTHIGSAMAATDCTLAKIPRDAFTGWFERYPQVQGPLAVEFARMLRAAYEKIGEQSLLPVKKRLLATLVEIARSEGRPGQDDDVVFVRPTHEELAQLIGSSRVVISRILKELLEEDDAIEASGRVMRVSLHKVELDSEF